MARPTALGMYIFAGGFTLGVKKHFDVICHLEGNPYGVATMNMNQPEIPVFDNPDRWPTERIREQYPEIDFMYGNPPCAAWSPIGRVVQAGSDNWKTDDRVDCVRTQFNALEYFRPKVWAWESVPQAYSRGWSFVRQLSRRAFELGYSVTYLLHNSQHVYGRQHRKRFFFVAHRVDIDFSCPFVTPIPLRQTLKEYNALPKELKNHELRQSFKVSQGMYDASLPGEALRKSWDRYTKDGTVHLDQIKMGFACRRSANDKPSPAYIGPRVMHPTKCRIFTLGEALYICGYPPEYKFSVKYGQAHHEIARAVMPPIGDWLAGMVAKAIKRDRACALPPVAIEENFFKEPGESRDRTEDVHDAG